MDNNMIKGFSSSKTAEWETPPDLYMDLDKEFVFTLDPCATKSNAKCKKFFTKKDNGLVQDWSKDRVFMNNPYNKPEKVCKSNCKKETCLKRGWHRKKYLPGAIDWVRKAYNESLKGALVVGLLPARTDSEWFHDYVLGKATEIRFLRGRVKFYFKGKLVNQTGFFPSIIVVWKPLVMTTKSKLKDAS